MRKGKPDVAEIIALTEKCAGIYGDVYTNFENDEKFYELDFKEQLNIPEEYAAEGIVLPTARDVVDTFVDHIDISHARVNANEKSIHNVSKEEAELLRKFYTGLIHRTNVESDISPWRSGAKHYAVHGLTVLKSVWDADLWPDKPLRKDSESEDNYAFRMDEWRSETGNTIPIVIQAINPANVMPDPYYGGRLYVIERHKQLLYDTQKMHPRWSNPKNKTESEYVEYISYWDKDYRCDLIDGEPILRVRGGVVNHNYGFIPYTLIETGLGNISIENKPEMRYVGILRYIYDLLKSESRNFSLSDVVFKRTALPWGVITGENAASVKQIVQKFGVYTPLPEGVELKDMIPQTPPDALSEHLARVSYFISAHAAPNSVRGLPDTGVRSAADRRLMITEASSRYRYASDAFRHGTEQVLIKCAKLLKNVIPGDVRVWSKTPTDEFNLLIKKDKLKEPFTAYVEFAPISEEDEYRRHDDLERLVSSTIVTRDWARRQMSNVDADAMARDEEKELLRMSPTYLAAKEQILQMAIQEELGASGVLPPPPPMGAETEEAGRRLVPPIPNKATPGSPEALQNSLKQMRSQTPMSATQGMGGGGNR